MTDIVERLRWPLTHTDTLAIANTERNLAADEIVRLRAELRRAHIDNAAAWGQPQVQAEEVARLRALITEWAEADDQHGAAGESPDIDAYRTAHARWIAALDALREEANR